MATGGSDRSVDSRVVCSVCLEPYRGRQPKLLPCFHTFCLPCLSQLAESGTHSQTSGDACSAPSVTIACPTCRNVIPVPPGGVAQFQSNFYVSDDNDAPEDSATRDDTTPAAMATREQVQDKDAELREKVRGQVKVMEVVLTRLDEEEEEIARQRGAMDHDIQTRYATGLRHMADARDQCVSSLRDAAQMAQDKLEADRLVAKNMHSTLSQLVTKEESDLQAGMLNEAALRHFQQVSTRKGQQTYFTYSTQDAGTSTMVQAFLDFMGKVAPFGQAPLVTPPAVTNLPAENPATEETQQLLNANSADIIKLRHELSALQTQNSQLRQDLTTVLADNTQLTKNVGAVQKDVSNLMTSVQAENTRLAADAISNQKKISAVEVETKKIGTDVEGLLHDVGNLHKSVLAVHTENTKLGADVCTVQTDFAKIQQDIATIQADHTKLITDANTLQNDVAKVQQDVVSVMTDNAKLNTNVGTMQKEIANFQKDVTVVQRDVGAVKQDIAAVQVETKKLEGDNSALRQDLSTSIGEFASLKAKASDVVAFYALLDGVTTTKTSNAYLVFSNVLTNVGQGYDCKTGIFTAPLPGVYIFMVTASPWAKNDKSRFYLLLDDQQLAWSEAYGENTSTCHAVLELTAGQRLCVQSGSAQDYCFYGNGHTYFSGVLVQARLQ
ncbi:hypothetical protein BaRGS_00012590 [Batillaria attramentaria]|uniref:C1q domain-containing protein n=1 Tax=Batillaria attramentaria TaxID=370345 RepID=A0ABD0LAE0_9CAEN